MIFTKNSKGVYTTKVSPNVLIKIKEMVNSLNSSTAEYEELNNNYLIDQMLARAVSSDFISQQISMELDFAAIDCEIENRIIRISVGYINNKVVTGVIYQ